MKYLIAGLGNIGPEYELTRHNIGFLILDRLADQHQSEFVADKLVTKAEIKHKGRSLHLIKPTTFMNLSGKAVNYWMQVLNIPQDHLLVVVDDISLPFGSCRLRPKGSAAGHNGLKNIEQVLGGNNYARLRFGIGNDFPPGGQVNYVLSNFKRSEFEHLPENIDKAADMILSFSTIGISRTMTEYND